MTNHDKLLLPSSSRPVACRYALQRAVEHGLARVRYDPVPFGSVLLVATVLAALLWVVYGLVSDHHLKVPHRLTLTIALPEGSAELSLKLDAATSEYGVVERRLDIKGTNVSGAVLLPPAPVAGSFWGILRWHENEDKQAGPWLELDSQGENWLIDLSDLTIHRLYRQESTICAHPVYGRPVKNDTSPSIRNCSGIDHGDVRDLTAVAARWSSRTLGWLDLRRGFLPNGVRGQRVEWHSETWLTSKRSGRSPGMSYSTASKEPQT